MSEDSPQRPAWQTEELQEEWIEEEPSDDDANNLTYGTRSISLTVPLPSHIHTNSDLDIDSEKSNEHTSFHAVGTFLVREDMPNLPVLPKTPGRGRTGIIKDFFSPLPLERMFEPPTPPMASMPVPPAPAPEPNSPSDEIVETDIPNMVSFHGRKASMACQFTFAAPKGQALDPTTATQSYPLAQSTPTPQFAPNAAAPPPTDPRLRLFQFQYDTFTRDHLSALADSIAVNSPSGTTTRSGGKLSTVSEASFSDLRSTKRVKLSPSSDYGEGAGAGASIARPKIFGKAYVGESQSLMEKIKLARDFSTISTVASADGHDGNASKHEIHSAYEQLRRSSLLNVPKADSNPSSDSGTINSDSSAPYSSSTYRQQAAALMAQIKSDMKGNKRIFSGDSEMSHVTAHLDDEMSFAHIPKIMINSQTHDKENSFRHHRRVSSTSSVRTRASPRRPQRMEAMPEADGELAGNMSKLSLGWRRPTVSAFIPQIPVTIIANPALLGSVVAPPAPAHPTATMRSGTNEDLNRFVSSSTASGTTLTVASVPSYVKHQGPAQLRTIAPKDVPALPERMGDMLFDKVMMKWVKSVQPGAPDTIAEEEPSEDPFGDIESLRDDSRQLSRDDDVTQERERERGDATEDEEEMELTSFSTDASGRVVAVMTGVDTDDLFDEETTDSEAGNDAVVTGALEHTYPPRRDSESESELDEQEEDVGNETAMPTPQDLTADSLTDAFAPPPIVVRTFTTPPPSAQKTPASTMKTRDTPVAGPSRKSVTATPVSAMKSTPSSALKDPNRSRFQTPRRTHRRSVSFSDGKRDGPIRGLNSVEPSVRSKRIAEMLARSDSSEPDSDSPTKGSGARASASSSMPSPSSSAEASTSRTPRVFSRSNASRSVNGKNGTFLTECSFGVAHDRIVEVLTDVEPFEPHWDSLSTVDLSNRRLESAARLKEFLPSLDALNLNSNELSWLSGIPGGVRTLSVASNRLTGLTSYSHLLNLENLDISRNEVDSLRQLACLRHLRELRADGNMLESAEGLERMDGLVKLSLAGNAIRTLDVSAFRWTRLEMLNVSGNRLEKISGLSGLQALVALNVDDNALGSLEAGGAMPRLRILRVSGNRLRTLHVYCFAGLRTLYADGNALEGEALVTVAPGGAVAKTVGRAAGRESRSPLGRLENLSLRNQTGKLGLKLEFQDVRDAKRLYLSGNTLPANFLTAACYNLVYLELANCGLTTLPVGLATLAPNLRALNLNYNFLEDVRGLEGLARLRKLSVVGARLKGTKEIIRVVRGLVEAEVLDFRMNPCTLGWYLPLIVQEGGEPELSSSRWAELDSRFRRGLPDAVYVGRMAYRGLVMRGCVGVRVLDGVCVTEKERAKAQGVLRLMER
ncbi:hypothetical protein R3P38DRAFT_2867383 [Favolaschia claudopus]|uniref:L domain-like protein n=1 Tax=Favolaschia claudopus TaxID=2862362 RepID=A0AAW0D9X0_9AGAR